MTKPSPPDPATIKATRISAGLTQTQAGELIGGSLRAWQDYEYGKRRMHPGLWELFEIKSSNSKLR